MKKLFFLISMSMICLGLFGQNYAGTVYDVGTRLPISNVFIQAPNALIQSQSDNVGDFSIFIKYGQSDELGHYYVSNDVFYWEFAEAVTYQLLSLEGKSLLQRKGDSKGSYSLPRVNLGYYYLKILVGKEQKVLGLFFDGIHYVNVQQVITDNPILTQDTSLVFAKADYYDREVPIREPHMKVNILKKEYDSLDYFLELIRPEAFAMIQAAPSVTNYGEVQSTKALFDFVHDTIYYVNVNRYPNHYWFAKKFLGFQGDGYSFFVTQYGNSPDRFLHLISINYHPHIDKYVFEFVAFDQVECEGVKSVYDKLLSTSFFGDKLVFYANKVNWENCLDIPTITSEELYAGQNYQALNLADGYGYLRKIDIADLPDTYLGKHAILLLNAVPNDVSVVSGIITTEFQTPLSHINILSHNRNTPNMALKDGWTNPKLDSLLDELVYLNVQSDSFIIRKATFEEASEYWNEHESHDTIVLEIDTTTSGLIQMSDANISFVKTIGGKAANFSELVGLGIPVPENYFAIPFYYYHQHLVNNGIDVFIDSMLQEEAFYASLDYRKTKLKELRNLIKNAPLDPVLRDLVKAAINNFEGFPSFRFRSSTNAEDLENFSGAGLYNSYSAKKNHPTKTIDRAIKKVWASLWNLRAFDERAYYNIDQQSIAMGVMVHRSFPDEDANGVIITANLYNVNPGYTFNVQYKEYSIVYPEPGILNDLILVYTLSLNSNAYTIEYLTHSNVPELDGQSVLTDEEITEIADYCKIIKDYYYTNIPHTCNCSYDHFAVDIEFKVDSTVGYRRVYIKQARLYSN